MMNKNSYTTEINKAINNYLAPNEKVNSIEYVQQSKHTTCLKVLTNKNAYFIKYSNKKDEHQLLTELDGLEEISKVHPKATPTLYGFEKTEHSSYLITEYIEQAKNSKKGEDLLGLLIAQMHQTNESKFGWKNDNYIAHLTQTNTKKQNWQEFYIVNRLEPQIKLAYDSNLLTSISIQKWNSVFHLLNDFFPEEKPSLLHGDLWYGNYLIDSNETPKLIDPSVYYGHREMDIGMTLLFGGFSSTFYESYLKNYPLENGWKSRVPMTQLYPILVHINLFGASYENDALSAINLLI